MILGIIKIINLTFQERQLALELQAAREQSVQMHLICLALDAKDLVEEFPVEECLEEA